MNQPEIKKNPFMEPYETLHDTVPFDKIKFEHYEEAFMEGIRRDNESIAKIVENPDTPTFRNTIAVEDDSKGKHYYDLLDRVSTVFSCMMSANTNDKMEELAQKNQPYIDTAWQRLDIQQEALRACEICARPSREAHPGGANTA